MVKILRRKALSPVKAAASAVPSASGEVTLDRLRPGETGRVARVEAEAALKTRLLELGFVAGSPVRFVMPTPFGDPGVYSLRGTSIALRKSEAQCIHVTI